MRAPLGASGGAAPPKPAAIAAAEAAAGTAAVGTFPGLADGQLSSIHVPAVQHRDRGLRVLGRAHLHEGEAPGATGFAVHDDRDLLDPTAIRLEQISQGLFGGIEGEISDVEFRSHMLFYLSIRACSFRESESRAQIDPAILPHPDPDGGISFFDARPLHPDPAAGAAPPPPPAR